MTLHNEPPPVATAIPPAIAPRILPAMCHEGSVTVTPVTRFTRAVPATTDISRACVRGWNDTLHTLGTRARVPVDPDGDVRHVYDGAALFSQDANDED